jgi:ABC-type multidrug transport system fused ATPase/permease subunit
VLKLIARLYDPAEGVILINGRDIRTYTLESLRAAMSILFQDFTHFPLSLAENIRMGDSAWPVEENMSRVKEAAQLGGAKEFIDALPRGYETLYGGSARGAMHVPTNLRTKSGDPARLDQVQQFLTGQEASEQRNFSGGQLQRLAL